MYDLGLLEGGIGVTLRVWVVVVSGDSVLDDRPCAEGDVAEESRNIVFFSVNTKFRFLHFFLTSLH